MITDQPASNGAVGLYHMIKSMKKPKSCTLLLRVAATAFLLLAAVPSLLGAQTGEASEDSTSDASDHPDHPADETLWNRRYLTGDWGGLRQDAHDHGFDVSMRFSQFDVEF